MAGAAERMMEEGQARAGGIGVFGFRLSEGCRGGLGVKLSKEEKGESVVWRCGDYAEFF